MKAYWILCCILAFSVFVTPVFSLDFSHFSQTNVKSAFSVLAEEREKKGAGAKKGGVQDSEISVLQVASNKVVTVDELEYVVGCVAGEMSPTCHEEALKAQAVAAYTNVKRLQAQPQAAKAHGADITDDTAHHQAYWDEARRRKEWGENFGLYNAKIQKAVESVAGQLLLFDGKPITAAFFDSCAGRTAGAKEVWGGDVPYLQSCPSPGDSLSPHRQSEQSFSPQALRTLLEKDSEIQLSDKPEEWISGGLAYTDSGSGVVDTLTVGGKTMHGNTFRSLIGLKSPAFSVQYKDGNFLFTVQGSGHFVGMSQYGAEYMARQGSDYREILLHYYPGVTLR